MIFLKINHCVIHRKYIATMAADIPTYAKPEPRAYDGHGYWQTVALLIVSQPANGRKDHLSSRNHLTLFSLQVSEFDFNFT